MTPHTRRAGAGLAGALAVTFLAAIVPQAQAQAQAQPSPHPVPSGPSTLPSGNGTIRGVVRDADAPDATGGLTVALYALRRDGTPGLGNTRTAADGSFAFEGIGEDPGIVYLVGVRYREVPYGERTAFTPGQPEIDLEIDVRSPSSDASGVRVLGSALRVDTLGPRLVVEEVHRVANDHPRPVLVPEAERVTATPPFEAALPAGAVDFETGAFSDTNSFELRDGRVLYWGPVYEGDQELRFGYQLPVEDGQESVRVEKRFPDGTAQLRVLAPRGGPVLESGGDLRPGAQVELEGIAHRVLEADAVAPGATLAFTVQVPASTLDPDAVSLGRVELAVELDDTVLDVTQTQRLEIAPGARVAGTSQAPLLRFELPLGAELSGVSQNATGMGIRAVDHGIEVLGPLGPGLHDFAYQYRMPAAPDGTVLPLRFPRTVPTLVLRAADTGLVIESDRLHRLRPQAIGTRTWIFREAFHVEPDELLEVRFVPLDAHGSTDAATAIFVLASAALLLFFVVSPLRGGVAPDAVDDDLRGPAHERELVYATIRDLDHDYETGKVAREDYERTRDELWARAIELMRAEQGAAPAADALEAAPPACPDCSAAVESSWRICPHCGTPLQPASEGRESRA